MHDDVIQQAVARILRRFEVPISERRFFYQYASLTVFRAMCDRVKELRGKSAWRSGFEGRMYDADTMNDPLEGRFVIDRSRAIFADDPKKSGSRLWALFRRSRMAPTTVGRTNVLMASLSEARDSIHMWRAYCPDGGVCVCSRIPEHLPMYRIGYGEDAADSILHELDRLVPLNVDQERPGDCANIINKLKPALYLVKAAAHEGEREVRVMESYPSFENLELHTTGDMPPLARLFVRVPTMYFRHSDLQDEVMIGPVLNFQQLKRGLALVQKEVAYRLEESGLGHVNVTASEISLRF